MKSYESLLGLLFTRLVETTGDAAVKCDMRIRAGNGFTSFFVTWTGDDTRFAGEALVSLSSPLDEYVIETVCSAVTAAMLKAASLSQ